jgi:putative tryptophan/tyrosine transport system substrate-binding protein
VDRRAFVGTVALGLLAAPVAADAQQAERVWRVGLVSIALDPNQPLPWRPFWEAMQRLGYVEGRNRTVKHAFANGRAEDLPRLVNELVRSGVDVVVTSATRETMAVKQATTTTPIVMFLVPDPVGQGFIKTLARPGGNITGLTSLIPGLIQKYVELLRDAVPSASRFGMVTSASNPAVPENRAALEAAAKTFGLGLSIIPVSGADDFNAALARAKRDGVSTIIAPVDPVTWLHRKRLAQAALKHRLPGIYWARAHVEEGGLMTYSADIDDLLRRAATYVAKILNGAKPADLPVEQPTKFELVINLKTAKALGSRSRSRSCCGRTR